MRNQLRLVVLLGGSALVTGASSLVACGDDTSLATDGGTTDSSVDAADAADAADTGADDGGDADTGPPFDGGFKVDTFDAVLATELCKSVARCCYGTPTPAEGGADGGTFDLARCEQLYGRLGFEGSNASSQFRDGGKVSLDQGSADSCIAKVKALSCNLPGSEFKPVRAACFGAYTGTVGAGGACEESIECKPGHFCMPTSDAGTAGTCAPLRALNASCGDFTTEPGLGDQACSYRAGGNTGRFCKFYDFASGVELPPADWKCATAAPVGSDCQTSLWCDQSICNNDVKCVDPITYFDSETCNFFLVP